MKKNSPIGSLSFAALKCLGALIRHLPFASAMRLGAFFGELLFLFDLKHRARAHANIRKAFRDTVSPLQARMITREFYRSFGQNLIDVFFLPVMDDAHIKEYISIEGIEHVRQALQKGRGVLLLAVHAGSWELSSVLTAHLGFVFHLFVRDQLHPQFDAALHSYRSSGTSRIIRRATGARTLISALKRNEAVGMTIDQGGKGGRLVDFFGVPASMATGAVKLALRYGAVILPTYYTRLSFTRQKVVIKPPFSLTRSGDERKDTIDNLAALVKVFEELIRQYPQDYLWTYKIWKYSNEREVLILDDGRTGHLRQSQAVAEVVAALLEERGIRTRLSTVTVGFKGRFARHAFAAATICAGKYQCQGCLACLRLFLTRESSDTLSRAVANIVISCGSATAAVNFLVSRQNVATSIVVLKPATLSLRRFDAVIMPRHDRPPQRANVIKTDGALNLVSVRALREHGEALLKRSPVIHRGSPVRIGVLLGGDTKHFTFTPEIASIVFDQVKAASDKLHAEVFVTTSRRTSHAVEAAVKSRLVSSSHCRCAVIANVANVPFTVEGILGVSSVVVVSPESISMVSEAASSGARVVVINGRLDKRHQRFLDAFVAQGYITLCEPDALAATIEQLVQGGAKQRVLNDRLAVKDALRRII